MRRLLGCLMSLVLVVGLMPTPAFAGFSPSSFRLDSSDMEYADPEGWQLNEASFSLMTWKQSESYGVRPAYLEGGVAVTFEGSTAITFENDMGLRVNLPKEGRSQDLVVHTPSSVTWKDGGKTEGVAFFSSDVIFSAWRGEGYDLADLRAIKVQAGNVGETGVTINRVILPGMAVPDVSGGAYGEGIERKLLYTRPVTLANPANAEAGTYCDTVCLNTEPPDVQGKDIAVRYTGDKPSLVFIYYWDRRNDDEYSTVRCNGSEGWTTVTPYLVVPVGDGSGQKVAFFSNADVEEAWAANGQVWADNHKGSSVAEQEAREAVADLNNQNTHYNNMMVEASKGACNLVEVAALDVDKPAAPEMRSAGDVRTGEQIIAEMGAGYNFGGQLESYLHTKDAAGKDVISFNEKDGGWLRSDLSAEISWGGSYLTEPMFKAVKERGFDTVRIPVSWGQHIYPEGDPTCRPADSGETDPIKRYHIDEAWMERVHQVVDFAMRNDLYVILNTHHEGWIDRIDMNTAEARAEMVEELQAVWTQIAAEFEGYDQRLIFEDVNEPHATDAPNDREWNKPTEGDIATVNALNAAFVELVHGMDAHKNRLLLCSTYGGHPELATHIADYVFPDDGSGLVAVSTHPYTPYGYLYSQDEKGLVYTGAQRAELDRVMEGVRTKFTSQGIPVVFDEFGCYYRDDGQGGDGRLEWLEQYVTAAKSLGIPCVAWPLESRDGVRFFDREACAWPGESKSYIDTWFGILDDDDVPWGGRRAIAEGEHVDIVAAEELGIADDRMQLTHEGTWLTNSVNLSQDDLVGKEIAVKFSGTTPRLALQDEKWQGWTFVEPSSLDLAAGIAYFSPRAIRLMWSDSEGTTWVNADTGESGVVGELAKVCITTSGSTTLEAAVLGAPSVHVHDWGAWENTATCTQAGTMERVCHSCDAVESRVAEARGHVWAIGYSIDRTATCVDAGSQSIHCLKCDAGKDEVAIPAIGHFWGAWTQLDAARHQRVCGHDASHVEIGDHDWDAGTVTKEATTQAEGERTYTCVTCKATKAEAIPKLEEEVDDPGSNEPEKPADEVPDPDSKEEDEPVEETPGSAGEDEPVEEKPEQVEQSKPAEGSSQSAEPAGSKDVSASVGGSKSPEPSELIDVRKASLSLARAAYVYDGKAKNPAVTLKYNGKTLKRGVDYAVSYSANKNVGTAKATVKGTGAYSGSKSITFKINPKPTNLVKLTAAKKGFTAKWKKQAVQTSGYQLQYSLKSSFKSAKIIAVTKSKTVSKKVAKLKAKKKYYVRVRTYKKVGKAVYYSTWSAPKSVKAK